MRPLPLAFLAPVLLTAAASAEQLILPPPSLPGCHRALTALESRANHRPFVVVPGLLMEVREEPGAQGLFLVREKEGVASFTPFFTPVTDGRVAFEYRPDGGESLFMDLLFDRGRFRSVTFGSKPPANSPTFFTDGRFGADAFRDYLRPRLAAAAKTYAAASESTRKDPWANDYPTKSRCLEEALGATVVLCGFSEPGFAENAAALNAEYCRSFMCPNGRPPFMRFDAERCGS